MAGIARFVGVAFGVASGLFLPEPSVYAQGSRTGSSSSLTGNGGISGSLGSLGTSAFGSSGATGGRSASSALGSAGGLSTGFGAGQTGGGRGGAAGNTGLGSTGLSANGGAALNSGFVGRTNTGFAGNAQAGQTGGRSNANRNFNRSNASSFNPQGSDFGGNATNEKRTSSIRPRQKIAFDYTPKSPVVVASTLTTRLGQIEKINPRLKGINIQVFGSEIVMTGTVEKAADKKLAETIMRMEPGVRTIRNDLEVATTVTEPVEVE